MAAAPLAFMLTGPATPCRVGEPIAISVEVRNISGSPLRMVGVLDGSEAGFRFPKYRPEISGSAAGAKAEDVFWCGTVAQLHLRDLILLKPGQGFDPCAAVDGTAYLPLAAFLNFRPATPGICRFKLSVDTSGPENEWLGRKNIPDEEAIRRLLGEVPRGVYVSNALEIEVLP